MEVSVNVDFFVVVKINEAYAISYDNSGPLSGRSYTSEDGINYSNNISNYGDINIRSKISYFDELALTSNKIISNNVSLSNAYPNPFNPFTTLSYGLPEDAMVNITIYDMMGRKINTLVSSQQTAGFKSIQWDATNNQGQPVSAGVYLYSIQTGQFNQTKKMILLE